VVDDDEIDREAVIRALDGFHKLLTIQEAATGKMALTMLKNMPFDCLILDYRLPDMDGLQFLKAIRQDADKLPLPVIMLTGEGNETVAVEAMKLGAFDYLSKNNFAADALSLRVSKALQHKTQSQLKLANTRLEALFANTNTLIATVEDGYIKTINNYGAKLLGYKAADLINTPLCELYLDDICRIELEYIITSQLELHSNLECSFRHRDGHFVWLYISITPLKFDNATNEIALVAIDISERRQMEAKLQFEQALLHNIIEGSNEGFLLLDADRRIIKVNAALCYMLGYQREEMFGHSPVDFCDAENAQIFDQYMNNIDSAANLSYEIAVRTKIGNNIPTLFSVGTIYTGEINVFAFITDMSRYKEYEQQLIQARLSAETANRAKSAFLANMSHELRTPLNAILGFAQVMQHSPNLMEPYKQNVQNIYKAGQYLLTLINDILDLAKVEAGQIELFPEQVVIEAFFQDVVAMFQFRAEQKGIVFNYYAQDALPYSIYIDSKRLRQVVMNLLGNAVKFTDHGHVDLTIEYHNAKLHIYVTDTGPGIDPQQHQEIFKPFTQTGSKQHKSQGTGLGLSITHKIIKLMDGQITLDSQPGAGSTFYIQIPVTAVFTAPVSETQAAKTEPKIIGYHRNDSIDRALRILIVDDIADNCAVIQQMLEPLGFELQAADSGTACLRLLNEWVPDLVLMDLRLPNGPDGLETTQQIHALPGLKKLPIIAVSASAYENVIQEAHNAGCITFIAKPINYTKLILTLQQHLPLEWQYTQTAIDRQKSVSTKQNVQLNETQRDKLLLMLDRGDILKINHFLIKLTESADCPAQVHELLQLAENYQLKSMRSILGVN